MLDGIEIQPSLFGGALAAGVEGAGPAPDKRSRAARPACPLPQAPLAAIRRRFP